MSLPVDFVAGLALDDMGRAILPDEILDQLDDTPAVLSAGANQSCGGTTNGTCTNGGCGSSSNTYCTNQIGCYLSSNKFCNDEPIG
jgi:hypothetical protein